MGTRIKRTALLLSVLFVFVLGFQNCGIPQFSSDPKPASPKSTTTEDNGYPYDGKPFVLRGDVCPDGTTVRSRLFVKSADVANLVRENCVDITPVKLSAADFQLDAGDPKVLHYKNQTFVDAVVGTRINTAAAQPELGFAFLMPLPTGAPSDSLDDQTISTLQLYEDGMALGPAHSLHDDIRNIGRGRFSHWLDEIYFTASDNSSPVTNGRTYSYEIR